jgi:sulfite exporter TauE/SafE
MDLWIVFLTGLTTGGLTCLAVQGGLLATALAKQVPVNAPGGKARQGIQFPRRPLPVIAFLTAKLVAYTLLGLLLGALGSALQLSPTVTGIMQLAAGLFMLATALNMLNVHPIFRYVVIQPPKAFTRLLRNRARSQELFAPALLGALTVLIPCGTTQAMEALAISSGSAIAGALVMFAFVLGTSPTFFVLGFLATQIRGRFQAIFATAAALLIIVLGFLAIDGGLKVLGAPFAPSRLLASLAPRPYLYESSAPTQAARLVNGVQEVTIYATNYDYSPGHYTARSGVPLRLRLVTDETYACTREFTIPSLGIWQILPATGEVVLDLPPQQPGDLYFVCGMGMFGGVIAIY